MIGRSAVIHTDSFSMVNIHSLFERIVKTSDPILSKCAITNGLHGRQVVATTTIKAGDVLFQEEPLLVQETFPCGCNIGALLAEHVTMSINIALYRAANDGRNLIYELSSGSNEFVSFESTVIQDGCWSCDTIIEMITVAVISAVDICRQYPKISEMKDENKILVNIASLIFDALSRLPQNSHGIVVTKSSLSASNSLTEDVSNQRVGIAIFTKASSMNHSCKPNCIVRYKYAGYSTDETSTKYVLEIIATESITFSDECTISYGPVWGYHRFSFRQQVLKSQYIFNCRCHQCNFEINEMHGNTEFNSGELLLLTNSANKYLALLIDNIREEVKRLKSHLSINSDKINGLLKSAYAALAQLKNKSCVIQEISRELTIVHCEYYDYCAYTLTESMRFDEAAEYILQCIGMLVKNQVYSDSDIPISRERVKLAQLYFSSYKYRKAFDMANLVHNRLKDTVADDDPDVLSCISILRASAFQL